MSILHKVRRKSGRSVRLSRRLAARTAALAEAKDELRSERERRWRLEEQCRHAHKMAAIGQLAGGVAHDFNNLLTVIRGYSDLLLQTGAVPAARACLEEITRAVDRASALTNQLLAHCRNQAPAPRVLDLNERVRDMERMLRRLIRENIKLITHVDPDLAYVCIDPGQMDQVILNLAINARDAMPDGGVLTITTENTLSDGVQEAPPGNYVVLTVRDTGCGMEAHTLGRIFEPFFTTKELGKGTGLGLATVQEIVRANVGYIEVASKPGQGSAFRIFLPAVYEPSPAMTVG